MGLKWQMQVRGKIDYLYASREKYYVWDETKELVFDTVRMQYRPHYRIGYKIRPRTDVWFYGPDGALWHGFTTSFDGRARCRRITSSRESRAKHKGNRLALTKPDLVT